MVLDQMRSMGGTRFFVSLNDKPLEMPVLQSTQRKKGGAQRGGSSVAPVPGG